MLASILPLTGRHESSMIPYGQNDQWQSCEIRQFDLKELQPEMHSTVIPASTDAESNLLAILDGQYHLQVKHTFIHVVKEQVCKDSKQVPWTDERANFVYGSYSPHKSCPMPTPTLLESKKIPREPSTMSLRSTSTEETSASSGEGRLVELLDQQLPKENTFEVSISESQNLPRNPLTGEVTSIGSAEHFYGRCKPCEWLQRGRECKYGVTCPYCHIIDEHGKYNRKKNRKNRPLAQISARSCASNFPYQGNWNRRFNL